MRKGTATIMIFMALSGCSEMPVRTLAITHRVEPCEQPASYAFAARRRILRVAAQRGVLPADSAGGIV